MPGAVRTGERRRSALWGLLSVGVLCLGLLPAGAEAGKVPSLASTAQYRAFTDYVKKLDALVGQPITGAQKATFEAELTAKGKAAAHKANALFNRASEKALAESDAMYREQAAAVRRSEEEELEALQREATVKLGRAYASYHAKLERLAKGHRTFEARAHARIEALRAKKAKAKDVGQKAAIQGQITSIIGEISVKRQEESTKRAQLKAAFQTQKKAIEAAAAKRRTEIGEATEAKIEKIADHWKYAYERRKAILNSKRESQLGYLDAKLEKGRADIATMPAA